MASASTNDVPRRSLGDYELGRRIAVGGMAEVFLARRKRDGLVCALKVPLPESAKDADYRSALVHEARVASRLDHPNVVRALELVEEGDEVALAMEYVDGVPLDRVLAMPLSERPNAAATVSLLAKVADALASVHEATDDAGRALGIVHRDVKPENVLVTRMGEPKLLDFGIARSRARGARTRTGTVKGTLRYLAPEQATGSDLDPRTDLYALALLAFELLSGAPYIDGASDLELLRNAEDPARKPFPESVPVATRDVLERCLARFPEDRPPSARKVAEVLRSDSSTEEDARTAWAEFTRTQLAPAQEDEAPAHRAVVRPRGAAGRVGAAAAVAFVALAGVAYLRRDPVAAPPPISHRPLATDTNTTPVTTRNGVIAEESPRAAPTMAPASSTGVASAPAVPAPPVPARTEPAAVRAPRPTSVASSAPVARADVDEGATATPTSTGPVEPPVDRERVRRRLVEADAAIRRAQARGVDVGALSADARAALELYAEGDYARADAMIARILSRSSRSE